MPIMAHQENLRCKELESMKANTSKQLEENIWVGRAALFCLLLMSLFFGTLHVVMISRPRS